MQETERLLLINEVMRVTARIMAKNAIGSATIVYSKNGKTYLLTNHHVIENNIEYKQVWDTVIKKDVKKDFTSPVEVHTYRLDDTGRVLGLQSVLAHIADYNKEQDIALLVIDDPMEYPTAKLYPKEMADKVPLMVPLACCGAALGQKPIITFGHLNGIQIEIDNYEYYLSSAPAIFGNCLPGDTLISMYDGSVKKISEIKEGDCVWSLGYYGLRNSYVKRLINSGKKTILEITTRTRKLRASDNHPILCLQEIKSWLNHKICYEPVWKEIKNLKEGDIIVVLDLNLNNIHVERIRKIETVSEEETYDIQLDNIHNFFANGVLVHNSGGGIFTPIDNHWHFFGIPSRVSVTFLGWSANAITHMSYFMPISRIYRWLDEICYQFIYDPNYTPEKCEELRKEKKERELAMFVRTKSRE